MVVLLATVVLVSCSSYSTYQLLLHWQNSSPALTGRLLLEAPFENLIDGILVKCAMNLE